MNDGTHLLASVVATLVLITAVTIGTPLSARDGTVVGQQQSVDSRFVVVDGSLVAPETANDSSEIRITATIRNDGSTQSTEEVDFRLGGEGRDIVTHRNVTIPGNSSQQLTFPVDTADLEVGSYIIAITTRDSSQFVELDISNVAEVDIDPHESNGSVVEIDDAFLPEGGYVAIHDESATDDVTSSSVIGVSEYLPPGYYEDVLITLFDVPGTTFELSRLSGNQTLVAVTHQETTNDRNFGFVARDGNADGPYLADGAAVWEAATINVTGQP